MTITLDHARALLNTPPPATVPGQSEILVGLPRGEDKPPRVCEHGNPRCGAVPVRPYVCGPRCEEHQPANTRPFFQPPK